VMKYVGVPPNLGCPQPRDEVLGVRPGCPPPPRAPNHPRGASLKKTPAWRRHVPSPPAPCRAERSNLLGCRLLHRTQPALVFLRQRLHATLAHVRNRLKAELHVFVQRRIILSDSSQPRGRGRRGRREPRFLRSRAVLLCMRTRSPVRRHGASGSLPHLVVGAADTRTCVRGLAWHVPCHARCSCRLVRRRMFGLGCAN
jgi:hypothetical protein